MKIKGNMYSILFGTAMAVIIMVALLLGGCPASDSATDQGSNGNTTASPVQQAINELSITFADGDSEVGVTRNVTLPASGINNANISWTSSNDEVIATTGEVYRPAVSETVTLIATAKIGEDRSTPREFQLLVLSDDDVITRVKETLEIQYSEGDDASSVTQDIVLSATGQFKLTGISWESDDTETIATNGKVSRPAKGDDDAEITLTATIKLGSATQQSRQFTLTVLAMTPTVPGKPVIGTTTPGKNNILVPWTTPDDTGGDAIIKYTVYWGTVTEFTRDTTNSMELILPTSNPATSLELDIGGLESTTTYFFVVTASNSLGEGEPSDEKSAATIDAVTAPGKPDSVTAMVSGVGQITVSWTIPGSNGGEAITEFRVYWGMTSGFSRETTNSQSITDETTTELVIPNLSPGTVYYFAVTAINSVGEGEASDEASAKAADVPNSPTGVSAALTGDGGITVSWTTVVPGADGGSEITEYRVYWGTSTGFTRDTNSNKSTTDGKATELIIENLTLGEEYFFVVTAINAAGESDASAETSITVAAVPGTPTGVTARVTGIGDITVSWKSPESNGNSIIMEYVVYWGTESGVMREGYGTGDGKTTEWVIHNLTPKTTYYFTVIAVNVAGEGDSSVEVSATAATVPGSPTGVSADSTVDGGISVSWMEPVDNGGADITGYRIYWGTSTGFTREETNSKHITDGSARELSIQNLTPSTQFYFVATAFNAAGEGSTSDEVTATMTNLPGYPTVVSASLTDSGKITVSWTPPDSSNDAAITEYRVYWITVAESSIDIVRKNSKATPNGSTTSLVIEESDGLIPGIEYKFFVSASNAAGEINLTYDHNKTNYKKATLLYIPDAPTLDIASLTAIPQQIRVTWTAPISNGASQITQYTVYWNTASGFDIASAMDNKIIKDVGTTETVIDGLSIGTLYYFVITATNTVGESPASNEISATPAQISSLISDLTLTIDSQDYLVEFTGTSASVDIDAMTTMAVVKEVSLVPDASGLNVNDELTISKGVVTISITAGDGSIREHIIHFRNPQITISATQLEIVDITKTDGTTKLPSQFMGFDISTDDDIKYQYSIEFLLVKDGSTTPTTLEEFHEPITMQFNYMKYKDQTNETDVVMAYKSALFPSEKTSLYLAHDSDGNFPLEQNTSYRLYAVQPQSSDNKPVNLGVFKTGTPVDLENQVIEDQIENPSYLSKIGKYFMSRDQFFVFVGMYGNDIASNSIRQLRGPTPRNGPPDPMLIITEHNSNTDEIGSDTYWGSQITSYSKPGWWAVAIKPGIDYYEGKPMGMYQLEINFRQAGLLEFPFFD